MTRCAPASYATLVGLFGEFRETLFNEKRFDVAGDFNDDNDDQVGSPATLHPSSYSCSAEPVCAMRFCAVQRGRMCRGTCSVGVLSPGG